MDLDEPMEADVLRFVNGVLGPAHEAVPQHAPRPLLPYETPNRRTAAQLQAASPVQPVAVGLPPCIPRVAPATNPGPGPGKSASKRKQTPSSADPRAPRSRTSAPSAPATPQAVRVPPAQTTSQPPRPEQATPQAPSPTSSGAPTPAPPRAQRARGLSSVSTSRATAANIVKFSQVQSVRWLTPPEKKGRRGGSARKGHTAYI